MDMMYCLQRQILSIFLYDQALVVCNAGSFSNSTCNAPIEMSMFNVVFNYLMIIFNSVAACQRTRKSRQISRRHPKKLTTFFAFILLGMCTENTQQCVIIFYGTSNIK